MKNRRTAGMRLRLERVVWLRNHGVMIHWKFGPRGWGKRYEPPDGWLSFQEAAVALGTNEMRFYRWKKTGDIHARKIGGVWMVKVSELLRAKRQLLAAA
jgi:Helix-turn-helix domain